MTIDVARFDHAMFFANLVEEDVSPFYPETESAFGKSLLIRSLCGTPSRVIPKTVVWSISIRAECIGFFAATHKRTASVKLGPIVISPKWRSQGFGRQAIAALERWYGARGITTLYMTMPTANTRAIQFASQAGFRPITLMHRQYSSEWDEISLAKHIEKDKYFQLFSGTLHPYADPPTIFHGGALQGIDYGQRPYLRFTASDSLGRQSVLLASLKRGGAVKLVHLTAPTSELYISTVEMAEIQSKRIDRRKLYSEVARSRSDLLGLLIKRGFSIEGRYALGRESYILSKALG